jgi:hypothetical protein
MADRRRPRCRRRLAVEPVEVDPHRPVQRPAAPLWSTPAIVGLQPGEMRRLGAGGSSLMTPDRIAHLFEGGALLAHVTRNGAPGRGAASRRRRCRVEAGGDVLSPSQADGPQARTHRAPRENPRPRTHTLGFLGIRSSAWRRNGHVRPGCAAVRGSVRGSVRESRSPGEAAPSRWPFASQSDHRFAAAPDCNWRHRRASTRCRVEPATNDPVDRICPSRRLSTSR